MLTARAVELIGKGYCPRTIKRCTLVWLVAGVLLTIAAFHFFG